MLHIDHGSLIIEGPARLQGEFTPPGDKSISHRALLLGSVASGTSRWRRLSASKDVAATRQALGELGVEITESNGETTIRGCGLQGLGGPPIALDCASSGTTMRLLAGLLSGQDRAFTLDGSPQLRARPMERVAVPLREIGADVWSTDGRPPVRGEGRRLQGGRVLVPVASAQVASALLLAGLNATDDVVIHLPGPVRDHTERMLVAMGADVSVEPEASGAVQITLRCPVSPLRAVGPARVPGDVSSAAFLLAAAAVTPGAQVTAQQVGLNPGRTGLLDVLSAMGARCDAQLGDPVVGEPIGDVAVEGRPLTGTRVDGTLVPRLVDEVPLVAVLGAVAQGTTVVTNASELRVKESDRISAMVHGLARMGAEITETDDGFTVHGGRRLIGAVVQGHGDHRIVMALAVAGLLADGVTVIEDANSIADSFPEFVATVNRLVYR